MSLTDLAAERARLQAPTSGLIEVTVRSTPDAEDELVRVSFDSHPHVLRGRGVRWVPRPGPVGPMGVVGPPVWPQVGDAGVVQQTDRGGLVLVAWWPATTGATT